MKRSVGRGICALSLAVVLGSGGAWAQREAPPRPGSRTEMEAYARELDGRVVELQHAIMAARHRGDATALEQAKKELATVQAARVDTLRTLGELP